MKKIIFVFALIFLAMQVSAVNFYGEDRFIGNNIIEKYYFVNHDEEQKLLNELSDNKPLEYFYQYSTTIDEWNLANPNNRISYCNFSVLRVSGNSTNSFYSYSEKIFNSSGIKKYFVQLYYGDSANAYMDCYFSGSRPNRFIYPATLEIRTPTWECKACQMYENSKLEPFLYKSSNLLGSKQEIISYMSSIFGIFAEDILILFWVLIILILLFSISLIFVGVYWLYLYIRRLTQ